MMTEDDKDALIEAVTRHTATIRKGCVHWAGVALEMTLCGLSLTPEQWKSKYRTMTGLSHKARNKKVRDAKTTSEISTSQKTFDIGAHLAQKDSEKVNGKVEIVQNFEPTEHDAIWKGNLKIRFGLMGDTHINSKFTQLTYLHQFYDECKRQGITHVYHTGDIDEGEQMRPGHQYECYTQGADDHVKEICRVYPNNGIKTHFIIGNHDSSIIKRCGYNIGLTIADRRLDMEYLGQDCAIVKLTPNCLLELRHPWDGSAYAISYKPQKIMDAMAGGEKSNILAIGHYHKAEYIFYRNIHCFQTGTFCAQTPFMRGKGLAAHMGGWIIDIDVDERGFIQKIIPQFIPFYVAIANDFESWRT
jgi:UDP-2,3-diacylglucosamine pyrophosphatase LpxH